MEGEGREKEGRKGGGKGMAGGRKGGRERGRKGGREKGERKVVKWRQDKEQWHDDNMDVSTLRALQPYLYQEDVHYSEGNVEGEYRGKHGQKPCRGIH